MRIGDYAVEAELAQGGSATVYRVRDPQGRAWALKLLRRDTARTRRRFEVEVGALARLRHPHLVPIVAWGREPQPHLVMPLLEGGTLQDRLREGPLAEVAAARVAHELALALGYAHDCGVSHRDVKPDNVLFDAAGRALLTDFSLALDEDLQRTRLSQTGASQGTPGYWAPEQCRGETRGAEGPRIDVHGLGATLFACLTGEPPYAASLEGMIATLATTPAPRVRALRPDVDPRLDAICRRCLAKEPQERYGDMTELARALAEVARGAEPAQRRRGGPLLGVALGLAVAGVGGVAWALAARGPTPAAPEATVPEPTRVERALALWGAGELEAADALLGERAAELAAEAPDSPEHREVLGYQAAIRDQILSGQRRDLAQLTEELVAGARTQRQRGDLLGADATLRGLEQQVPDSRAVIVERTAWIAARDAHVDALLARMQATDGDDHATLDALAEEVMSLVEHPLVLEYMFTTSLQESRFADTLRWGERFLRVATRPSLRAQIFAGVSNARMRLGDRPGALAALEASLAEVEDPRAYALRAEYLRREDPQAALADLERAAELDPTPARRFEAGALAWRAGSAERAVELLAALAQEQPDLPDVHHELGNAYRTLGRNAEADAALTAQLERAGPETNLGGVHWARLQVRRALGDLDGALEDAERLHAHVPESGEGRFLPALLRLERGEEGARATLEREVARTAANEALAGYDRVCLALAWERLGEPERACGALYGLKDGALSAITRNYAFDPWLPGLLQRYCELLLDGRDFDHGVDVATLWLQRYAGSGHPGEDGLRRLVEREGGRAE